MGLNKQLMQFHIDLRNKQEHRDIMGLNKQWINAVSQRSKK